MLRQMGGKQKPTQDKRVARPSNANQCDAAWLCAQAINLSSVALGKGRDSRRNLWSQERTVNADGL